MKCVDMMEECRSMYVCRGMYANMMAVYENYGNWKLSAGFRQIPDMHFDMVRNDS